MIDCLFDNALAEFPTAEFTVKVSIQGVCIGVDYDGRRNGVFINPEHATLTDGLNTLVGWMRRIDGEKGKQP